MNHMANTENKERAIVTVIGKDRVGIIAGVTTMLADMSINILDISQTIMDDMFTMTMMVDLANANTAFDVARDRLVELGNQLGMKIHVQHENVFTYMHRI